MEFCEYCGNILLEDGSCPDPQCIHNLLLEVEGMNSIDDKEAVE